MKNKGSNGNVRLVIALFVVIGLGFVAYGMSKDEGAKLYSNSPVVGKIDGKPVYKAEADEIVNSVLPANSGAKISFAELDENSKNMILREIAAQRIMLKEAKKNDIKETDEIKRKVYEYKNKLIRDALINKVIAVEITPEKLQEKYAELEKSVKGQTQIRVSHILVDSEDSARKAEELLKKESFAKVAKEVSVDSSTKDKGGDIGYLITGTMDPAFEKAALALKTGEVSEPVKTKFGWHIIKLDERKAASIPSFDSLKVRIAQEFYGESLKKYADKILADTKIELVAAKEEKKDEKAAVEKPVKEDKKAPAKEVKDAPKEEEKK